MPPFVQHLQGARDAGGLIVVDPRRSATAAFTADGGGLHLQPLPGTDLAAAAGPVPRGDPRGPGRPRLHRRPHHRLRRLGPQRGGLVAASGCSQSPAFRPGCSGKPPGGWPTAPGRGGSYILTGRGVEQHVDGTDTATAAINLSPLLGLPGSARSGYGTLTGQGNGQGGREHGQKADQLPGYRKITDPAARAHVAAVWGVPGSPDSRARAFPPSNCSTSLGQPGGVRCLLVHGANLAVSAPDANAVLAGPAPPGLPGGLRLLSLRDRGRGGPGPPGHPVGRGGRHRDQPRGPRAAPPGRAMAPPPGVRSELWIMAAAGASGCSAPSQLQRRSGDGVRGAAAGLRRRRWPTTPASTTRMLDRGEAAYWPYPAGSTGTPRLFRDRFAHPDGRAVFVPVGVPQPRTRRTSAPLGRTPARWRWPPAGCWSTTSPAPRPAACPISPLPRPEARLQIHPATAAAKGIGDGGSVRIWQQPRRGARPGRAGRGHPAGHGFPAVPLPGRAERQPAHRSGDGPGVRHAGVQNQQRAGRGSPGNPAKPWNPAPCPA